MHDENKTGLPESQEKLEMGDWRANLKRPNIEFPRKYLPSRVDLQNWEQLEKYLTELNNRQIPDLNSLEKWMEDYSEFSNVVGEEESRLYIDMTCFTNDKEKEKAYLHYIEEIEPKMAPYSDKLNRKIDSHPETQNLPKEEYSRWLQSIKVRLELFDKKNIPLQTRIGKLSQQYQKIVGDMTVEWNGETKTLSQMSIHLRNPDRSIREKAWRLIAERRLQDKKNIDEIFDEMFSLRQQVAKNLGIKNYVEYSFKNYLRDYTPEACLQFGKTMERKVMALVTQRRNQIQ